MKYELDNFIIESDIELDYLSDIANYVSENENKILDFFELDKLPNKVKILILSYDSFKDFIISKYGEILDYYSGDSDSKTNTIRVLNIEDQIKYTIHKNANLDAIKSEVLHEIVHQCHNIFHKDYKQINWFSEGLATNLANQEYTIADLNDCDFDRLKNDFRHYKGNYKYAYTIVNYILNNYSKDEIIKLYSDPDYLREKSNSIFEEAKNNIYFGIIK